MEMSNAYIPELHVAQQRRRDKLRVQQLEDLHTNNFHHHQNNQSSLVFPSEMLNFTSSTTFPSIHPSRFVAPSSTESCDPQPLQSCDNWVTNYEDNRRRNLMMSQFVAHSVNCNPTSTGEMSVAHQYYPNHVHNWEHGGNELPLLPSFVGQPNDADAHQVHNHGLSLSLSSNQISEMHRLGESRELKPLESGSISSVVKVDSGHNQIQNAVGSSIHMARNVGPLGPFTGYTTILKSSKFLKPAQQLLDEFFSGAGLRHVRGFEEDESMTASMSLNSSDSMNAKFRNSNDFSASGGSYRPDCHERKTKLLHMQEEVCKRHKQYHEQMEMVISAFETVPGLSNATPYISRSLMVISRHFRHLKNAIADQIRVIKRAIGEDLSSPTSFVKGESSSSGFNHNFAKVINSGSVGGNGYGGHQNHVWRPQRGLPERAVSILRAWLFDHFLHPYPTDSDKQMLASQTGLSRNQVSNWFINARVRLWKPMVEEIHMLETKGMGRSETNVNNRQAAEIRKSGHKPSTNTICDTKPLDGLASSSSVEGSAQGEATTELLLQKFSRMEQQHIPNNIDGSFVHFLPYQRRRLEVGGIGAVSLTLGLTHGSESSHQQQLQHTFHQQGMHYGGHVMHDFSG